MKQSELDAAVKLTADRRAAKGLPPHRTPEELRRIAIWGGALMVVMVLVVGGIIALNWNTIQARSEVQQKCEQAWNDPNGYYHGAISGKSEWVNDCIANTANS